MSSYLEPNVVDRKTKAQEAAHRAQLIVKDKALRMRIQCPTFQFLELIGKGSFGRVYKSKDLKTGLIVAIKIIDVDKADIGDGGDSIKDFLNEINVLTQLKDNNARNINLIYEAFAMDTDVWIVSEYCSGGSVHTLMRATPQPGIPEKYIIPIARELAEALKWVHDAGIIHRDVKAANVLVSQDGHVQLCDFGVSAILATKASKRSTILGTPNWMAPELHNAREDSEYGKEIDTWAFGCTLIEMATGFPPNVRVPPMQMGNALKRKIPRLEGTYSPLLKDLVAFCLAESPESRPTVGKVQLHPYLFGTAKRYPTSILTQLVEEYEKWEKSGGERHSLFFPGGAPMEEFGGAENIGVEDESWNFSVSSAYHGNNNNNNYNNDRLAIDNFSTSPNTPTNPQQYFDQSFNSDSTIEDEHHPLKRIFDQNDSSSYEESYKEAIEKSYQQQQQQQQQQQMAPLSDLPLRNQHPDHSSTRESVIDLDALPTIRPNRDHTPFFFDMSSEEETTSSTSTFVYQDMPLDGGEDEKTLRRATKDWKFPTSMTVAEPAERRATKDWKFPSSMMAANSSSINNNNSNISSAISNINSINAERRATKDWKFPSMTTEPTVFAAPSAAAAAAVGGMGFRPRVVEEEMGEGDDGVFDLDCPPISRSAAAPFFAAPVVAATAAAPFAVGGPPSVLVPAPPALNTDLLRPSTALHTTTTFSSSAPGDDSLQERPGSFHKQSKSVPIIEGPTAVAAVEVPGAASTSTTSADENDDEAESIESFGRRTRQRSLTHRPMLLGGDDDDDEEGVEGAEGEEEEEEEHEEDEEDEEEDEDEDPLRFVKRIPIPAPPSIEAMTEGADPEVLKAELVRLLTAFNSGLGVAMEALTDAKKKQDRARGRKKQKERKKKQKSEKQAGD
ncbi:MAG: hypothetical protein M1829_001419 [Trizodia sp. TS-e1964]|nr:MAG: hypothetical protein M1829_001419 [Trizodia sp. TS-e1964]